MNENKIFVGGLSWQTTSEKLSAYFSAFGEVTDVVVMVNQETGKSRGFAFVSFKEPASVQNVLSKSQHQLDGRNIDPKECNLKNGVKTKKDTNFCKIFVGGLPHDIKEDVLKDFFDKYGNVTEVVIMYDQEKKKTRGFGFVSFDTEDTVNKLVEERFLTINGKKIEIKKAEPQRPMLRSNSSSMTNISMQSSHNGYLSALSPYVPQQLTTQPPAHHQLHTVHTIMPPQNPQNLDASFQFAYHPNSYSTMHHTLHHNTHARQDNAQFAGYAPHHPIQTSSHPLVSQAPWPLEHHPAAANHLEHLHSIQPHHSMQTSPNSSTISTHHQSILPQPPHTAAISLIPNNAGNLVPQSQPQQQQASSESNTPSSTPNLQQTQQNSNSNQQTNNVNLTQPQQIQHPQSSITPTSIPHPAWYAHHPQTNLIANPNTGALQPAQTGINPAFSVSNNPAFSQAITFGYPTGYVPAGAHLMPTTHWQPHQNPYLYGAYPIAYQPTAPPQASCSPPTLHPTQSITPQEAKRIKLS